jgi:hypothetical protein
MGVFMVGDVVTNNDGCVMTLKVLKGVVGGNGVLW